MFDTPKPGARWRTSSRSNNGGACVEVCTSLPGVVLLRDSKHRTGGTLTVPADRWTAFLDTVRTGRLDT